MLVIIGIDPGITTGLAAIGMEGELAMISSLSNARLGDVLKAVVRAGRPVLIASDVSPPPKFLKRVSSKLPASLFFPKKSMGRQEKIRVAEAYSKKAHPEGKAWGNRHERDALAAAVRAWRSRRPLITRVMEATEGLNETEREMMMACVLGGKSIDRCRRMGNG